jgi:serine/threonine protein phosphatase 1
MIEKTLAPGLLPPGIRVYAIGDVHGCLEQLVALHYAIAADLKARPVAESVLVHIGDYVDRGPDSAGVIWLLLGTIAPPVTKRVDLMGNHEVMMADAIEGANERSAGAWLSNGGEATLASYKVPPGAGPAQWSRLLPIQHRQWIRQRDIAHVEGNYLFVHAGIRPGRALEHQTIEDMLWIREPFLSSREQRRVVVVHGHTPREVPDVFDNRIGIDTGAAMGGLLTCVVLEGDQMSWLTAKAKE